MGSSHRSGRRLLGPRRRSSSLSGTSALKEHLFGTTGARADAGDLLQGIFLPEDRKKLDNVSSSESVQALFILMAKVLCVILIVVFVVCPVIMIFDCSARRG